MLFMIDDKLQVESGFPVANVLTRWPACRGGIGGAANESFFPRRQLASKKLLKPDGLERSVELHQRLDDRCCCKAVECISFRVGRRAGFRAESVRIQTSVTV